MFYDALQFVGQRLRSLLIAAGIQTTGDLSSKPISEIDPQIVNDSDFPNLYLYCLYVDRFGDATGTAARIVDEFVAEGILATPPLEVSAARLRFGGAIEAEFQTLVPVALRDQMRTAGLHDVYDLAYGTRPPALVGENADQFDRWGSIARLAIEGRVEGLLSRSLLNAGRPETAAELRTMQGRDFNSLVRSLRQRGSLPSSSVVRHPGHLLPTAIEIPAEPTDVAVETDGSGRPAAITGMADPGAAILVQSLDQTLRLEGVAEDSGLFRLSLDGIEEGRWDVTARQWPVTAVAFSDPSAAVPISKSFGRLSVVHWTPGDSATDVPCNVTIEVTFSTGIDPGTISDGAVFLTGERVGPVYSDVVLAAADRVTVTPRTSLIPNETYTVRWRNVRGSDGSRAEDLIITAGQFRTGSVPAPSIGTIVPSSVSVVTGWTGRPVRIEVKGTNLPHGIELVIGDLLVTDLEWLGRDHLAASVLADRVGQHPVALCVPGLLLPSDVALSVTSPSTVSFVYGEEGQPGPNEGEVHVFVPDERPRNSVSLVEQGVLSHYKKGWALQIITFRQLVAPGLFYGVTKLMEENKARAARSR